MRGAGVAQTMMDSLLATQPGGVAPMMSARESACVSPPMTSASHRLPVLLPNHLALPGRDFSCRGMKPPLERLPPLWGHRGVIVLLIILIFNAGYLKGVWPFKSKGRHGCDSKEKESNQNGREASAGHVDSLSYSIRWAFIGYFHRNKAFYVDRTLDDMIMNGVHGFKTPLLNRCAPVGYTD